MGNNRSNDRLDTSALMFVDAAEHFATHDDEWLDYWASQTVEARLAGANRCRRQVDGPPQPIDRSAVAWLAALEDGA